MTDGADGSVFNIWPGPPPGSEDWDWTETTNPVPWPLAWNSGTAVYTRNVVVPTLTVHRAPADKANGTAMIVAPGGAFHFLMMDHEGHDMARWLNERGVTAFVLKYRLGRTPDSETDIPAWREDFHRKRVPVTAQTELPPGSTEFGEVRAHGEEDGRQAIRVVRERAAEFGIDANKIGIAGYSAGGGVSMGAAMQFDAQSRPDFAVGIYPAYRAELSVPDQPMPLFLVAVDDDTSVAPISTSRLYEAWHKKGGAAELHVFNAGGHGFGMAKIGALSDIWPVLLENWMRHHGLIGAQA
jgi:predicted esterase